MLPVSLLELPDLLLLEIDLELELVLDAAAGGVVDLAVLLLLNLELFLLLDVLDDELDTLDALDALDTIDDDDTGDTCDTKLFSDIFLSLSSVSCGFSSPVGLMPQELSEILVDLVLGDLVGGGDDDEGDIAVDEDISTDGFDFKFPKLNIFLSEGAGEDDNKLFSR